MTARLLRPIENHPITAIVVIVVLGFVVQSLFINRVAHDSANRYERESNARIAAVEDLQRKLEDEARARTTQSCADTAKARAGTIAAWNGVLDFLTPKDADGNPKPSPQIGGLRQIVSDAYPAVTCPQDQGPIVIPVPTTTEATPP